LSYHAPAPPVNVPPNVKFSRASARAGKRRCCVEIYSILLLGGGTRMDRDFLSEFLDLNGDGHVTPEEARIGLSFLETALHREPELWDEDGFDENAADDDGE